MRRSFLAVATATTILASALTPLAQAASDPVYTIITNDEGQETCSYDKSRTGKYGLILDEDRALKKFYPQIHEKIMAAVQSTTKEEAHQRLEYASWEWATNEWSSILSDLKAEGFTPDEAEELASDFIDGTASERYQYVTREYAQISLPFFEAGFEHLGEPVPDLYYRNTETSTKALIEASLRLGAGLGSIPGMINNAFTMTSSEYEDFMLGSVEDIEVSPASKKMREAWITSSAEAWVRDQYAFIRSQDPSLPFLDLSSATATAIEGYSILPCLDYFRGKLSKAELEKVPAPTLGRITINPDDTTTPSKPDDTTTPTKPDDTTTPTKPDDTTTPSKPDDTTTNSALVTTLAVLATLTAVIAAAFAALTGMIPLPLEIAALLGHL